MRLAIGGPTRDTVPASVMVRIAELYAKTRERGPWAEVGLRFLESTYIHCGRELTLEAVKKQGFDHLLWIDTDMSVPAELAILLAAHNRPVVGVNYRVRQPSGLFTAQRADKTRVATTEASTGLEAVAALGFGAVLMRTDVVDTLGRPWFRHGINDGGGDIGEDITFFAGLRAAGYEIWLDHDLSKTIGHVGQYTYRTVGVDAPVPVGSPDCGAPAAGGSGLLGDPSSV